MQLINHAPVSYPKPVRFTALKLGEIVVRCVGIPGNLLDLRHNTPLPVPRKPGERFVEGLCSDDRVHDSIVTNGNILSLTNAARLHPWVRDTRGGIWQPRFSSQIELGVHVPLYVSFLQ